MYFYSEVIGTSTQTAGGSISVFYTNLLDFGVFFALVGGPLADKMKRVKGPVVIDTFALAVAALFPLFVQEAWDMFAVAVIAAFGNGL